MIQITSTSLLRKEVGPSCLPVRQSASAFTLVELLVVIGIIAILISMLLPSLSRARAAANSLACQANLRSLGQAVLLYAQANKDRLPYDQVGYVSYQQWFVLVQNTLVQGRDDTVPQRVLGSFRCPASFYLSQTGKEVEFLRHYAPLTRLFTKDSTANGVGDRWRGSYKLSWVRRPTELVMMADASQQQNGSANYTLFNADSNGKFYDPNDTDNDTPVDPGPDQDSPQASAGSTIRWRHGSSSAPAANFLFCDGHVESRSYVPPRVTGGGANRGDLLKKNMRVDRRPDLY